MQGQTAGVLTALEGQSTQVKEAVEGMDKLLKDLAKADKDREGDIKNLKEDLEALKELIPKMVEKTKEDQKYAMGELQSELKSLRSLLLNRSGSGSSSLTSLPSASPPAFSGRPGLPAWQLAPQQTSTSALTTQQTQQGAAKEDDKEKSKEKEREAEGAEEATPNVEEAADK